MNDKVLDTLEECIDAASAEVTPSVDPSCVVTVSMNQLVMADFRLAQRCVAGEVRAWEELYSQCHGSLVNTISSVLRGRSNDANLADEIAAQVWYALVAHDGELLTRYDTKYNARLITFLRTIARDLMCRHFRSERRREVRETKASGRRPRHHASELDQLEVSLDEFLASLSPSEQQFCAEFLLDQPDTNESGRQELRAANVWQKTHRVYGRFRRFFSHDG